MCCDRSKILTAADVTSSKTVPDDITPGQHEIEDPGLLEPNQREFTDLPLKPVESGDGTVSYFPRDEAGVEEEDDDEVDMDELRKFEAVMTSTLNRINYFKIDTVVLADPYKKEPGARTFAEYLFGCRVLKFSTSVNWTAVGKSPGIKQSPTIDFDGGPIIFFQQSCTMSGDGINTVFFVKSLGCMS